MSDLERGKQAEAFPKDNIVTWDGPDDQANPKNWSFGRKWIATGLVSLITFMSPLVSSMIAPAQAQIGEDLNVHSQIQLSLIFSIFLLGFVVGPLFIGPMSEIYGRVIVLQLCNIWFLIWCLVNGFAQNDAEMLAFRFISGLGACAPQTVGGGVLGDLWASHERGKAVALYTLAPILGPSIGPIVGAWVTEKSTWRWSFWAVTIFGVAVQILLYFTLSETYGPRILYWKAKKLRKETGNENLRTEYELEDRSWTSIMSHALVRPFVLLFTQPIVIFLAIYMSLTYGLIYLMLATFPTVWTEFYHESVGIGGLNYLSLAIGMTAGAQTSGWTGDYIFKRLSEKSPDGKGRPEFRVPLLFLGSGLLSAGLFMYGWSAGRTHWIVPNIGAAIFGGGTTLVFTALQTYTIDAYQLYAASAIACTAVTRSMTGFGFPLFAPAMFNKLGWGWGNSLLGFLALGIGYSGACVLWFYGERLRKASPYAAHEEKKKEKDEEDMVVEEALEGVVSNQSLHRSLSRRSLSGWSTRTRTGTAGNNAALVDANPAEGEVEEDGREAEEVERDLEKKGSEEIEKENWRVEGG